MSTLIRRRSQNARQLHRLPVRTLERREDAPAALEQAGKTGVGTGLLRTRQRMTGNEMHTVWHMRRHLRDDGCLGRADIGDDGAQLQVGRDLFGDRFRSADGNGDDDEIGILDRLGGRFDISSTELQFFCPLQRLGAAGRDDDLFSQPKLLHVAGDRRADEADTDQGDADETGFGAHAAPPLRRMKSASAATTSRFASSVPTERRRWFGSP